MHDAPVYTIDKGTEEDHHVYLHYNPCTSMDTYHTIEGHCDIVCDVEATKVTRREQHWCYGRVNNNMANQKHWRSPHTKQPQEGTHLILLERL